MNLNMSDDEIRRLAGPGTYSRSRTLEFQIKSGKQQLECAPLGPRQKKQLAEAIHEDEQELARIRIARRLAKNYGLLVNHSA